MQTMWRRLQHWLALAWKPQPPLLADTAASPVEHHPPERSPDLKPAMVVQAGRQRRAETSPTPRGREFMIIGLGRFGTSLAKTLVRDGHDVLAVDSDYGRVQMLSTDLPNVVQIDATNEDALREVGADHFDTAIVCIGTDFESNMLATVLLRRLGVRRIITKARTRTQKEILEQIGADEVILPEHDAGRRLAQRLTSINVVDYLQLGPEMSVVEMRVPRQFIGQTLIEADLRRRYDLTVLAIRRHGQFTFNPSAEFRLEQDDELLVIGSIDAARRLSS